MICTKCGSLTPLLKTKACPSCGGSMRLSAEDILGDSELRIVSEVRPPQVELAKVVEEAISKDKNAITEAGTGTGKSLALLVPAILARKRVLISTATTLLQHQYVTKDLPFLLAHLADHGYPFKYAVAKGRSHYVCFKRLKAYAKVKKNKVPKKLIEWAKKSEYGDKLELGQDLPKYWNRVNAEDCAGASACKYAAGCGIVKARAQLKEANVVVANHAIVGFNMRLGGKVLPAHDFYIIDEAHQACEYFRRAFASTLNERSIPNALYYLTEEAKSLPTKDRYDALTTKLYALNKALFEKFPIKRDGSFQTLKSSKIEDDVNDLSYALGNLLKPFAEESGSRSLGAKTKDPEYAECLRTLEDMSGHNPRNPEFYGIPDDVIITSAQKLQRIMNNLRNLCLPSEDDSNHQILYLQFPRTEKQSREIVQAPVFIGDILKSALFSKTRVVAASATLTVNDSFEHFTEEMGFEKENTLEYITASPFDYAKRAVLYLSKNVPIHPSRDGVPMEHMEAALGTYYAEMADEIANLTNSSKGHAFVLFTSRVEMNEIAERLQAESNYPVRTQEEGVATGDLEKWFRVTENPILCGLKSFWEGVSIEGDQLRLVIIAKAPFPQQGDPVYQAKKEIMEKKYGSWFKRFQKLDIPAMITDVKQGTGRLIRTKLDYGVAAILDRKVANQANRPRAYASLLKNSLPYSLITYSLGDVNRFLRQFEVKKK